MQARLICGSVGFLPAVTGGRGLACEIVLSGVGKDTHAGAEALRFARSHLPYINLWYGKAALDHMLLHGLQENMSPGYLARQRTRHQKDWGGSYWWEPGADFNDMRAPDMGAAVGN